MRHICTVSPLLDDWKPSLPKSRICPTCDIMCMYVRIYIYIYIYIYSSIYYTILYYIILHYIILYHIILYYIIYIYIIYIYIIYIYILYTHCIILLLNQYSTICCPKTRQMDHRRVDVYFLPGPHPIPSTPSCVPPPSRSMRSRFSLTISGKKNHCPMAFLRHPLCSDAPKYHILLTKMHKISPWCTQISHFGP